MAYVTLHGFSARDRRIAELESRLSRLTDGEMAELDRLTAARDNAWKRLPHRIDAARRQLERLTDYARRAGVPVER